MSKLLTAQEIKPFGDEKFTAHNPKLKRTLPFIDRIRKKRLTERYGHQIWEVLTLLKEKPIECGDLVFVYMWMKKKKGWDFRYTHKIVDICFFCGFISEVQTNNN